MGNPSFMDRRQVRPESIGGFAEGLDVKVTSVSDWRVTMLGAEVPGGPKTQIDVQKTFHEVSRLGDPVVLGMPSLDE